MKELSLLGERVVSSKYNIGNAVSPFRKYKPRLPPCMLYKSQLEMDKESECFPMPSKLIVENIGKTLQDTDTDRCHDKKILVLNPKLVC